MMLTQREREIIALLRRDPLAGPQAIADALGSTRAAVNVHLSNLGKKGAILGRGYIPREENAVVVVGADGDLVGAVADRAATEALGPADLPPARELIAHADMLVLDGNLPAEVLAHAMDVAQPAAVPVVIDPVSAPKAALLTPLLTARRQILALTPNLDELRALLGHPVGDSEAEVTAAAGTLHARGVRHVWVRLGPRGSVLSPAGEDATLLAAPPAEVADVTGAGDAMLAAFVHALLAGGD